MRRALFVIVPLAIALLVGWVWNIVKLTEICCGVSGWLVLRVIGIFVPPLGGVLGYF